MRSAASVPAGRGSSPSSLRSDGVQRWAGVPAAGPPCAPGLGKVPQPRRGGCEGVWGPWRPRRLGGGEGRCLWPPVSASAEPGDAGVSGLGLRTPAAAPEQPRRGAPAAKGGARRWLRWPGLLGAGGSVSPSSGDSRTFLEALLAEPYAFKLY